MIHIIRNIKYKLGHIKNLISSGIKIHIFVAFLEFVAGDTVIEFPVLLRLVG